MTRRRKILAAAASAIAAGTLTQEKFRELVDEGQREREHFDCATGRCHGVHCRRCRERAVSWLDEIVDRSRREAEEQSKPFTARIDALSLHEVIR